MNKLVVSSSPHIRSEVTTKKIMLDVIIALLPASIAAVVLFGSAALANIAICVGACVLSEYVFNRVVKKEQTISDLSAVVTGLILALNLPAKAEAWHCIVGSVFAIVVVKCLFGGIGCNFANPAATARILLMLSFTSIGGGVATNFQNPLTAGATPLEIINNGAMNIGELFELVLFFRNIPRH